MHEIRRSGKAFSVKGLYTRDSGRFAADTDTCILERMKIEEQEPNKPNFGLVVALFAGTILLVIIAAVVILMWRSKSATKTPFTKHPVSRLCLPQHGIDKG